MRVLIVNSGLKGTHWNYTKSLKTVLIEDFNYVVKEVWPQWLRRRDIDVFEPAILFVFHGNFTPPSVVKYAQEKGVITLLWIVEDPYEIDVHTEEWMSSYDYIYTNELEAVSYYQSSKVYYLPWCTDPRIFKPKNVQQRYQSDLCFVGMGFKNRINILNRLADFLQEYEVKLIGDFGKYGAKISSQLQKYIFPVITDQHEICNYYNGAKINLNIHRSAYDDINVNTAGVGARSLNNRTFDIAGTGSFQLVDDTRRELESFYEPGEEIITFTDICDLKEKIKYFLEHEKKREEIARNALKRTRREHTYHQRLKYIFDIIGKEDGDGIHYPFNLLQ